MADPADDAAGGATQAQIDEELARITAAPDFARAPVMRRLLEFLVRETLAGRGDGLKAYAVAVDGLGRSDDFDAQADSYPRVQVGRLRRMLDAFYARDAGANALRLHIPPGQYRVFFRTTDHPRPATPPAQPDAPESRPDGDDAPPADDKEQDFPTPSLAGHGALADATKKLRIAAALLLMTVLALIAGAIYLARRDAAAAADPGLTQPPRLIIAHIEAPPSLDAIEVDTDAILLDALRRSWLVRLYDEDDRTNAPAPRPGTPVYKLTGTITPGRGALLRMRLTRADTGELVWTGQALLPADRASLRDALTPLIVELIQPYGVIASDERAMSGNRFAPGQRCILEFNRYRRDRTASGYEQISQCVDRTLAIDPSNAMALAAKSFLVMDRQLYRFGPPDPGAPARSLLFAQRATAASPYNAFTHLAMARAAQFGATCGVLTRSGRRAIALNPYDPDMIGILGILMLSCDDPDAESLLRRAIALDPESPINIHTALTLTVLDRGDIAGAQRMTAALPSPPTSNQPFVEMTRAIVAAASGNTAQAKAHWARLAAIDPETARNPQSMFDRWQMPKHQRMTSFTALARAGIIPAPPPSAAHDPASPPAPPVD
ncbi:hypothetical protein [Sphingomonas sp. KC8]|uniref:hypothetical protein n=1 Tax=Sphingomonas sp. KC8 TaxID=1030157 RepID=UPI000248854A|nr:hypothetical protein [Sphingomonas sp. KC8]ARS28589.1 hypothetical protein KC8_15010 [Sphingomonas sp. KC8]